MKMMLGALLTGIVLDLIFGDPQHHPVCTIGRYISWAEKKLRARGGDLRKSAVFLTASAVLLTMTASAALLFILSRFGKLPLFVGMAVMNWLGLAVKSLASEARGVRDALGSSDEEGRKQVARIVGRDTQQLTREEVIKATIETVAENTTDGVIAPMLYAALGGPVLLWGFKAASTLDSMVGYMDERYRDIGWASAKLDDALNYIPARLTAMLLCVTALLLGLDGRNALRMVMRDHDKHKSPNCAWSEAAAAGALHIQLGGTHAYFGKTVEKPTIGDDDRPVCIEDIDKVNRMLYGAALWMAALIAAGWIVGG